jgi:hypothetical protein
MGQMNRLDPHSVKTSSDRSFGLIFAIVFGVIAVWPLLNGFPLRSWATWLSFAFVMIALIAPTRLAPLNRRWTQFGLFLHKIVNPIIPAPSPYNQTYYWATRSFYDTYTAFAGGRKNFVSDAFAELIKKLEDKSLKADHPILKKVDWRTEANGILLASKVYIHDQKVLSSVCKALNIHCFTVLQPVLPNRKTPVGNIEQTNFRSYEQSGLNQNTRRFYSEVKLASLELQNRNYHLIDLSDLPNNPKYINLPLFYDFGHGGFFTGEIIGKEMALEVLRAQRRINN